MTPSDLAPRAMPDGVTNVTDLLFLLRLIECLDRPTTAEIHTGDLNGDGVLTPARRSRPEEPTRPYQLISGSGVALRTARWPLGGDSAWGWEIRIRPSDDGGKRAS